MRWSGRLVAALCFAAALWGIFGSRWLFPLLSRNHDEAVYLYQADALGSGYLFPPAPEPQTAYQPWFGWPVGDHYVLKYTPVHASLIALGMAIFDDERAALGLISAWVVAMTYLLGTEVARSHRTGLLGAFFVIVSPVFLVQSATFLPYASNVALLASFVWLLLSGSRLRHPLRLSLGGVALGLTFFARPFDALLVATPIGLFTARRLYRRGELTTQLRWFLLGAVGPVALLLAFNHAATEHPLRFPFSGIESSDTLGFGLRRLRPEDSYFDFTPMVALEALVSNMLRLPAWTAFVPVAAVGFRLASLLSPGSIRNVRSGRVAWMAAPAVAVPFGYLFFWGSADPFGMVDDFGPFYYLPALVFLAVIAAQVFARLTQGRAALAAALLIGSLVASLPLLIDVRRRAEPYTRSVALVQRAIEAGRAERKLVLVPKSPFERLLHPLVSTRNAATFDSALVFALDDPQTNPEVLRNFPDHVPYRLRVSGDRIAEGLVDDALLEPLRVTGTIGGASGPHLVRELR